MDAPATVTANGRVTSDQRRVLARRAFLQRLLAIGVDHGDRAGDARPRRPRQRRPRCRHRRAIDLNRKSWVQQ